jgi:diguanylate cyclase (GGDEF)-like protein
LLDDHDDEREMDDEEVTEFIDIYYNRLRSAILEEYLHISKLDPLTGLFNRREGEERFGVALELLRRSEDNAVLSVAILDVDHFKRVNDTYGHDGGDRVLRGIGALLRGEILSDSETAVFTPRITDTIYRFGGEEIAFVMPQTAMDGGQNLAEKVRAALSKISFDDGSGGQFSVTATIGVAEVRKGDVGKLPLKKAVEAAIKKADKCLYAGKQGGRNRVVTEAMLTP